MSMCIFTPENPAPQNWQQALRMHYIVSKKVLGTTNVISHAVAASASWKESRDFADKHKLCIVTANGVLFWIGEDR